VEQMSTVVWVVGGAVGVVGFNGVVVVVSHGGSVVGLGGCG
jgi:hypothetical protein